MVSQAVAQRKSPRICSLGIGWVPVRAGRHMRKTNSVFETVPLVEVFSRVPPSEKELIGENTNGRSKRVLVVDDERVIADTLATILRGSGYEAIVAYNAEDGLRQCAAAKPQLVLADVVMPGMNGIEMAVHIQDRYPGCKVVLISGQASISDLLEDARRRGYDFELLAKPIHPEDLLARLATIPSAAVRSSPRG